MNRKLTSKNVLILISTLLFTTLTFAQRIGDPGMVFDESKYDSRIPLMKEWAKAGVQGGIPFRNTLKVRATLTPKGGDRVRDIQNAINKAANEGGGVVLLKAGNYDVASEITLKSNVVLRGEGKGKTWLTSRHRFQGKNEADKRATIRLVSTQKSGLEDFSMRYEYLLDGKPAVPVDLKWNYNTFLKYQIRVQAYQNEKVFYPNQAPKENLRHKIVKNIDVGFVEFDGNTKNSWIDNCEFLNSGSFGIRFRGAKQSHVTLRDVKVKGSLQAGSNGHGYGINCSAKYTLMVGCDVSHVRHWAIQQGAEYCVVVNSKSGTDMNFHQKDLGKNLIEKCDLILPDWHLWKIFQTGATFHGDPGKDNYFYDNNASKGGDKQFTDQKIYTFSGRDLIPLKSGIFPPKHRVLYAMKSNGSKPKPDPKPKPKPEPKPEPKPSTNKAPKISFKNPNGNVQLKEGEDLKDVEVLASDEDGSIANVKLYLDEVFVREEKVAPYEWGKLANLDAQLRNLKEGIYVVKAEATDDKGAKSNAIFKLVVSAKEQPVVVTPPTENGAPKVSFLTPKNNLQLTEGEDVKKIEVLATDADGIANVRLYVDEVFVRQENVAPYEWANQSAKDAQLKNLKEGIYVVKAEATDKKGVKASAIFKLVVSPKAATVTNTNDAPVGKTISLKKSGGDQKYVTGEKYANDSQVLARSSKVGPWEKFVVEAHPKGGIALKALSNGKYLQVESSKTSIPVKAKGNSKGSKEQFEWKSKGNGKVAIKSVYNGKWLQASHRSNNALVLPRGDSDMGWETFNYEIVKGKKEFVSTIIGLFPNPANAKSSLFLEVDAQLAEKAEITLFDITGKNMASDSYDLKEGITLLDISDLKVNLSSGIYIISYVTSTENSTYKLVID